MNTVWREYGVIFALLVVAVGGYLYMSRSDSDLLASSLDAIGGHLLSMVPDGTQRSGVQAALDTLESRVNDGTVPPGQIERYAASVFNMGTSGQPIAPEEAEMVVRLAYSDPSVLEGVLDDVPEPPGAPTDVEASELERLAAELQPMVAFFETVKGRVDSTGPGIRFYSDGKLHVVVDDRMRSAIESGSAAQPLIRDRAVSWRAHFSEAAEAERVRYLEQSEKLARIARAGPDTLHLAPAAEALARMSRLRSLGFVPEARLDSIMGAIEVEVRALMREGPPPPPPAPETGSASVSSRSR